MSYERKRDFICRHIVVQHISKRCTGSYKQNSRTYYLTVNGSLQRVCKTFFIKTLDISDKTVRCALGKKSHGVFQGTDGRGKHIPTNKTSEETLEGIRQPIQSFPVMDSHYKRKNSKRKFLQQDLSIAKMYDLYKIQCTEKGIKPASAITYRRVFCTEFNISFQKPKKDSCEYCNAYSEKEKTNMLTPEDIEDFNAHIASKKRAREEKEHDKENAKSDRSVFSATFNLEAVLYTPCSNVSQIFYKRKMT